MCRNTEELYKNLYADALEVIEEARGIKLHERERVRDLADRMAKNAMNEFKEFEKWKKTQ